VIDEYLPSKLGVRRCGVVCCHDFNINSKKKGKYPSNLRPSSSSTASHALQIVSADHLILATHPIHPSLSSPQVGASSKASLPAMLNAFNARSIFELTAKDRFKIDSLLAYGIVNYLDALLFRPGFLSAELIRDTPKVIN
jgi:hypothetical protein